MFVRPINQSTGLYIQRHKLLDLSTCILDNIAQGLFMSTSHLSEQELSMIINSYIHHSKKHNRLNINTKVSEKGRKDKRRPQ